MNENYRIIKSQNRQYNTLKKLHVQQQRGMTLVTTSTITNYTQAEVAVVVVVQISDFIHSGGKCGTTIG